MVDTKFGSGVDIREILPGMIMGAGASDGAGCSKGLVQKSNIKLLNICDTKPFEHPAPSEAPAPIIMPGKISRMSTPEPI